MKRYDLCLAWNWEYDADFVSILERVCQGCGVTLLQIRPDNLASIQADLFSGRVSCLAFFDRASDEDNRFLTVVNWARLQEVYRINPYSLARRAWNKATMHIEIIAAGLHTPATILLPPYQEQPDLPPADLQPLGTSFAIKPAHGGGGKGVVTEATSWDQVLAARQAYPLDGYLLHAHISPEYLEGRQAWFRVIYCAGQVYPCWWDTRTHIYTPVSQAEKHRYALQPLWEITALIAKICQLQLFSTEIALAQLGSYLVVDYINDPIDLRLQSKTPQGVPDQIVAAIAGDLSALVAAQVSARTG